MRYEILDEKDNKIFDEFVFNNPNGCFMQTSMWPNVKSNWGSEKIVCKDENDKIVGAALLLIQRIPALKTSFIYCSRGPICDYHNIEILKELKKGIDVIAKREKAHSLKWDPDVLVSDKEFLNIMKELKFRRFFGPEGFETIQARFNYRLYLNNRNEEQVLMDLTQQCRRNIRLAERNGVEVRICGKEAIDDFSRIMKVTGKRDGFNTRPKEYFVRFLESLGEHARLYIAYYEGNAIAGALCTNYSGKTCYVYGASDNVDRKVMPNYLVQWEMIKWAIQTNCTVYDFQGISGNLNPENNHMFGLYRFKRGFNGQIDELCGEFDYVYNPLKERMVNIGIKLNSLRRKIKR